MHTGAKTLEANNASSKKKKNPQGILIVTKLKGAQNLSMANALLGTTLHSS